MPHAQALPTEARPQDDMIAWNHEQPFQERDAPRTVRHASSPVPPALDGGVAEPDEARIRTASRASADGAGPGLSPGLSPGKTVQISPVIQEIDAPMLPPPAQAAGGDVDEAEVHDKEAAGREPRLHAGPELHWVSRRFMVTCLLLALAFMLGHHFYYAGLVGDPVGGFFDQQRTRFLGNLLPYVVQALLVVSIDTSFTQYLFHCLTKREVPLKVIDAAYSSTSSMLFVLNPAMWRVLPDVTLLAILISALAIPTTMITPGTLVVQQTSWPTVMNLGISRLAISDPTPNQSNFFQLSRPANGSQVYDNSTVIFLGPRTIISKLTDAAAAAGRTLPVDPPPAVNATYQIEFFGPYVQCEEANETVAAMIDRTIAAQRHPTNNLTEIYNGYTAYVPDLSSLDSTGYPSQRNQIASNGSNQLWLSFKRNSTGWETSDFPKCPDTEYRVCKLYNATYALNITFENNVMNATIAGGKPVVLNEVAYPGSTVNTTQPYEMLKMSYSAFMWAMTDLLTGSMGLYNNTSPASNATAIFTKINTGIQETSLLGTPDLNCFFAVDWKFSNRTALDPPTPQRQQDMNAAGNATLDQLIPELSANLTISLMNDALLAPNVTGPVTVFSIVDVYDYHASTLLASYGAALLAGILANLLGMVAFHHNRKRQFRIDRSFSSTASATQHTHLLEETHWHRRGSVLPVEIRDQPLRFEEIAEGGWGFKKYPPPQPTSPKQRVRNWWSSVRGLWERPRLSSSMKSPEMEDVKEVAAQRHSATSNQAHGG